MSWNSFITTSLFVTLQLLDTITEQTNEKARRYYDIETTSKEKTWRTITGTEERLWRPTTGTEIGGFLGVLLISGLYKLPKTSSYWNNNLEKPFFLPIQRAFSLVRWEQIKHFFKISPHDPDFDSKGPNWYTKLDPWYSHFKKTSRDLLIPGREISVDE